MYFVYKNEYRIFEQYTLKYDNGTLDIDISNKEKCLLFFSQKMEDRNVNQVLSAGWI
jgi:hypothetical protein